MLLNILRPKFFIPIHGELRHLKQHALLAQEVGIPRKNIAVVENGYTIRFSQDAMEVGERVPGGYVFVDGTWVGAVSHSVIKERESLATAGVCTLTMKYDQQHGNLVGSPRIVTQGMAAPQAVEDLVQKAMGVVRKTVQVTRPGTPPEELEKTVKKSLSNFFYQQVKNRPVIIVMTVPVA
jgi:ribonuclease J